MTPVIQRISDGALQSLRPFLEFLPVGRISCNIALFDSIRTHLTPFVMVAAHPYLGNIIKLSVFCDFLRTDMTVVIQNRHLCCILMIQHLRSFRLQKEILIHKCFHTASSYTYFLSVSRTAPGAFVISFKYPHTSSASPAS